MKSNGLRVTTPRISVLRYLDTHRDHPDVNTIYRAVKRNNRSLSKTSVYNILQSFVEKGLVNAVIVSDSERRYEYNIGMHHHLFCKRCERIIDILQCCPNLGKRFKGHMIDTVHGFFKGVCTDCLAKGNGRKR